MGGTIVGWMRPACIQPIRTYRRVPRRRHGHILRAVGACNRRGSTPRLACNRSGEEGQNTLHRELSSKSSSAHVIVGAGLPVADDTGLAPARFLGFPNETLGLPALYSAPTIHQTFSLTQPLLPPLKDLLNKLPCSGHARILRLSDPGNDDVITGRTKRFNGMP